MHLLKDRKKKLFFYLLLFIFLSTLENKKKNFSHNNSILNINNIEVLGLPSEENIKIAKDLKYLLSKNIFFIKREKIREILKNHDLVQTFTIDKIYPSIIRIEIEKTNFIALTIKNNNKFFIASNGKLISFNKFINFNKKIPFVFGNVDQFDFISFKKLIDDSDFIFNEISEFYYFPSNRWDIKTNSGLLIKLPQNNLKQSLEIAYLVKSKEEFKNNKIIDLRNSNHIITSNE